MSPSGIYGRIAVRPPADCLLRQLSERVVIQKFVPGRVGSHRPQVALRAEDFAAVNEEFPLVDVVEVGENVICRLPGAESVVDKEDEESSCATSQSVPSHCQADESGQCLAFGFSFLPVEPYALRWESGWLYLSIAARSYDEIQRTIKSFNDLGVDVDLKQIVRSGETDETTTVVVDLASLTDRQRQIGRLAARRGYFSGDGADAADIADELGITPSTLSKHLRSVIRELFSQIFQ